MSGALDYSRYLESGVLRTQSTAHHGNPYGIIWPDWNAFKIISIRLSIRRSLYLTYIKRSPELRSAMPPSTKRYDDRKRNGGCVEKREPIGFGLCQPSFSFFRARYWNLSANKILKVYYAVRPRVETPKIQVWCPVTFYVHATLQQKCGRDPFHRCPF